MNQWCGGGKHEKGEALEQLLERRSWHQQEGRGGCVFGVGCERREACGLLQEGGKRWDTLSGAEETFGAVDSVANWVLGKQKAAGE
jgi:hypothetical protein